MFCRHCGAALQDRARFCPNCCAPIDYDYQTGGIGGGAYIPKQAAPYHPIGGTPIPTYKIKQAKPKKKHTIRNIFLVLLVLMVIGSIDVNVPKGNSICCGGTLSEGAWDYNDSTFLYTEKNGYEQEISMGNGEHIRGYYLPAGEYELELVEAPLQFTIYQFVPPSDERYYAWSNTGIRYNLGETAPDMKMFMEIVGNEQTYSIWATNGIWENGTLNTYPKYVLSMGGSDKITLDKYNLVVVTKGKMRFIPY